MASNNGCTNHVLKVFRCKKKSTIYLLHTYQVKKKLTVSYKSWKSKSPSTLVCIILSKGHQLPSSNEKELKVPPLTTMRQGTYNQDHSHPSEGAVSQLSPSQRCTPSGLSQPLPPQPYAIFGSKGTFNIGKHSSGNTEYAAEIWLSTGLLILKTSH